MQKQLEDVTDRVIELEDTVSDNTETVEQLLEVVISMKAKLEAMEELLVVNGLVDKDSMKELEELNTQEILAALVG